MRCEKRYIEPRVSHITITIYYTTDRVNYNWEFSLVIIFLLYLYTNKYKFKLSLVVRCQIPLS